MVTPWSPHGHPMAQVTMKPSSRSEGTLPDQSSWRWIPIPDTTQITGGWEKLADETRKFPPNNIQIRPNSTDLVEKKC